MFLVNRLFGISPAPAPELTAIDGGRFFLVRPDTVKGSRECIFIDASISIRRVPQDFTYELVVIRTFQDGEDQLLDEDAENVDERSFQIDDSLFLSLGPSLDSESTALSFTWLNPEEDDDEFEFVLPESTAGSAAEETAKEFERLVWRCIWERMEKRSWPTDLVEAGRVEATLEDRFKVGRSAPLSSPAKPKKPSTKVPLFYPPSDSEEEDIKPSRSALQAALAPTSTSNEDSDSDSEGDIAAALTKVHISAPAPSSSAPPPTKKRVAKPPPPPAKPNPPPAATPTPPKPKDIKGKGRHRLRSPSPPPNPPPKPLQEASTTSTSTTIATVQGDLFLFDLATASFMGQEEGVLVSLHKLEKGDGYWLIVQSGKKEGTTWVSQEMEDVNFAEREQAMVFNFRQEVPSDDPESPPSVQTYTWLVKFPSLENFEAMQAAASEAIFESKFGRGSWKKLQESEKGYQKRAYIEDAEMYGIEEEGPEDEEVREESEEEESEEDYEEESDEDERASRQTNRAKNSQLAVGYKEDLSFVVQGDMIGVFKQQREGGKKLKFMTSITNIATPDGKKFTPNKVMLHNQDTKMILQNPLAPGALFELDLETGKVVDEYKISENFDVTAFIPDSKFAQTTQQQTFIGLSHNGAFRIDPRLNGMKLVESEHKQYATKTNFTTAATTEGGRLAVASAKGEIRLFDTLGKNAKTVLPALGDPIIGLDVSADGKWVLATTKTYLLLVDCVIPEGAGKYGGSSGFDRSFPKDSKPVPKRLQLRREHSGLMESLSKEGVNFTPAKFNAGLDETEKTIVSSSGPFVIAWNFRQVKAGNTNNYTIRRFSDTVIADAFKFGGDREIIVTLPANVFVEEKKKLKAPTRDSMSRIVNTWEP